jgi:hypothetical protein
MIRDQRIEMARSRSAKCVARSPGLSRGLKDARRALYVNFVISCFIRAVLAKTKFVCDQQHPCPHCESNGPQQTAKHSRLLPLSHQQEAILCVSSIKSLPDDDFAPFR